MEIPKREFRGNGLGDKMLALAVLPILVLGIVLMVVSMQTFSDKMEGHVRKEMTQQTKLILKILDENYPGEFSLNKDVKGNYHIYKGGKDITKDTEFIDNMKEIMGVEVTLFCQDVRLQTTLRDSKGRLFINTAVSSVITKDVLKKKKAHFYRSTTNVGDERYFAYYEPIFLEDGTCFGMVGVCRKATDIEKNIRMAVRPILLLSIAAIFVIGAISISYTRILTKRIRILQQFMKKLTKDDFEAEMPAGLLKVEDEIGDLARSGKKMQESIRRQVEYDEMTQLYNRRYGDKNLLKMKAQMQISGIKYCVAIGDIDFFKKVNDNYGHEAGDEVLIHVARVLKEQLLANGFVCRWGGEEFLIVIESHTIEQAEHILQSILDTLRNQTITYQEQQIRVTMSMGLVSVKAEDEIDDILRCADQKLYEAKENGRDQIRC
ncbi:MAG: diguanylate cyclase [Clostridium sp.]|uniref:sensor domain-containing diguanylate cyclase n=1 Tax=unclassified Clostridium TaxID=2614128 RepID=UPI00033A29A8|nr:MULTISPECIES: diguanylate cyclase [unclassified Clostridium]CCZ52655.1 response regulator/GGDEF domain protein [Clostridium sp. CAG:75]